MKISLDSSVGSRSICPENTEQVFGFSDVKFGTFPSWHAESRTLE